MIDPNKQGTSLLHTPERMFIDWAVPKLPQWMSTKHLTSMTLIWSILIIIFAFLARGNIAWLWGINIMIFLQWLTDALDGSLGRARNEGFVKWGFYMDHFLDYIFLSSIIIGYAILLPANHYIELLLIQMLLAGYMVHSFLTYKIFDKFQIAYYKIGPTEIRIVFIVVNVLILLVGKTYMAPALPWVLGIALLGLVWLVIQASRKAHRLDKAN